MKTIIKIFAAVLTAVPVLASCYSEPLPEVIPEVIPEDEGNGSEQDATTRIITLSFDTKATRTYLDGKTPKFSDGDEIAVALADAEITDSDNDIQICTVSVDENGIATTTTTFTEGELMAVYPAGCALVGDDGKLTYMVPYKQNGKFKDANICTATIPNGNNPTAVFKNKTAVFVLNLSEVEFSEINVLALDWIDENTGQRSEDYGCSYVQHDDEGYWYRLVVQSKDDDGNCYISVLAEDAVEIDDDGTVTTPAVLLRDICFDVALDQESGLLGGFSPKFLISKNMNPETATVQVGAMYTGVEDHLHAYHINSHYSGSLKIYKWADEDLETDGGDFFMWGELDGHSYDNGWTNFTENSNGFASGNSSKYSTSFSISSYNSGDILRLEDDAVYQNWGGSWRMPTYNEISTVSGSANKATNSFSDYTYVTGNNQPKRVDDAIAKYYWTSVKGDDSHGKVYSYLFETLQNKRYVEAVNARVAITELSCFDGIRIKPMSGVIEDAE